MGAYKTRTRIYSEQAGGNVPGNLTFVFPLVLDNSVVSLDAGQILNKVNIVNAIGTTDIYQTYFSSKNFRIEADRIALPEQIAEVANIHRETTLPANAVEVKYFSSLESKIFFVDINLPNVPGEQWLGSSWQTYTLSTTKDASGFFNYNNGSGGTQILQLFKQLQQSGETAFDNIHAVWQNNKDYTETWGIELEINELANDYSYGWGTKIALKWNNLPYADGQSIEGHFVAGDVLEQSYGTGNNGINGIGQVNATFYVVPSLLTNNLYIGVKISNSLFDHWASGKQIHIRIWRVI